MIHVIGLPHTRFDLDNYTSCAFTAKTVRWSRMLTMIGREHTVYWGGNVTNEPVPYVCCMPDADQVRHFGEWDANVLPVIEWDVNLPYWREFNQSVIRALHSRVQPGDIIALPGGRIHQELIGLFPGVTYIEPGVGYEGLCDGTFACFESYAWMHNRYGACGIGDGRAFDAVIANALMPEDWETGEDHGYALFVGRLIQRKGPHVAGDIAKRLDMPLKMAGAGVRTRGPGLVEATDGTQVTGDVEHVGAVSGEARKELYAHASVMLVPTLYIGPWEGVHAEALASGVQVVAPDYGVFTETIAPEFRYRTLGQAVECAKRAIAARGEHIRHDALSKWSMEACAAKYKEWLDRIDLLKGAGWYA